MTAGARDPAAAGTVGQSVPLGVTMAPLGTAGPAGIVQVARVAEQCGLSSLWVAEASSCESFVTLAAVAAVTERIGLSTGVVPLQLRTPALLAMSVATLLQAAPDRLLNIGIGFSSPAIVARWHGAEYSSRPIAQMREFVAVLRACLSGEKVRFTGDFYRVDGFRLGLPVDMDRVKILVAALNPQMLTLAGEVADGVLLNYLPLSQVDWAIGHVRAGGPARIFSYVHGGIGDVEAALPLVRREIFGYLTVDAYARIFERSGYGAVVQAVRDKAAAGDRPGALDEIPLELVQEIKCIGSATDVRQRLADHVRAGVEQPVLFPLTYGGDPVPGTTALLEALRPGGAAPPDDRGATAPVGSRSAGGDPVPAAPSPTEAPHPQTRNR